MLHNVLTEIEQRAIRLDVSGACPRVMLPDLPEVLACIDSVQDMFDLRRVHYFTAPIASPRTRWRCINIMNIMMGIMMPIAAAADRDQ